MNAVVSVIGKDQVGILAFVSKLCADNGANILDVSQTVMQDTFAMIMMINIDNLNVELNAFIEKMANEGKERCLQIHVMHENVFNSMHRI